MYRIELGKLLVRVLTGLDYVPAQAVELPVVAQVHQELGQREVLRQPDREQNDAEQAQTHAANTGLHRAAGAVQPHHLLAAGAELLEQVRDILGQRSKRAGGDAAGQRIVRPQVAQDLDQMGLAAAVEAADPVPSRYESAQRESR
jgi:hypothetical protein